MNSKPWKVKSESHSVVSNSLRPQGLHSPWNSPGQNTGVGSLSPLQGIFPTQGLNPGIPNCRQTLYQLSHKGSPKSLSHVQLFFNPMDRGAWRAPLSMWFPRQEYWSGLPCPSPGDLPDPGTEPRSPALQADSLPSERLVETLNVDDKENTFRKDVQMVEA